MSEPEAPFQGQYDEHIEAFFKENRIFLRHPFKWARAYRKGDTLTVDPSVRVERYATMPLNRFVSMGAYSYCISRELAPGVRIGRYCSVASNVRVLDADIETGWVTTRAFPFGVEPKVYEAAAGAKTATVGGWPVLGDDVWIGQDVMIRRGVTIGTGAIVAAGSVVTQDVAPYTIVGGVDARPIKPRFPEPLAQRMLKVEWWRYNFADFEDLPVDQPEPFLDGLEAKIAAGEIQPFEPGVVSLASALRDWVAEKG